MSRFVLDNAELWIGDGSRMDGHVIVDGECIEAVAEGPYAGDLPTDDLGGAALSPGLIDLMCLGGFGQSIRHGDPVEIMRRYLRLGVTSCQTCTGTLPWDVLMEVIDKARSTKAYTGADAARFLGVYLEGPFMHPDLTGASQKQFAIPPSPANVRRTLDDVGDLLTMINVSPGAEGDVAAVKAFREAGVVVSMAHSNAPADRVLACVEAGTSVLGHVFDNNSGLIGDSGVQQPTIEHVALIDERVRFIHMICDGSHVHPLLVKLVKRCRGTEAICLVTDAVMLAGAPDGPYTANDGRQFLKKDGVGRTDQGWLCGSGLLLPDHLRNFIRFTGTPPHEAIRTVTLNPAASIGLSGEIGLLTPGRVADLVAWDSGLIPRRVWRRGEAVDGVSDYAEIAVQA